MTLCGRRAHQRYDETTGECCSRLVSSAATCLPMRLQLSCDSSGAEDVASGFGMEPIATGERRLSPALSCIAPVFPSHETFLLLGRADRWYCTMQRRLLFAVVVLRTVSLLRLNVNTASTAWPRPWSAVRTEQPGCVAGQAKLNTRLLWRAWLHCNVVRSQTWLRRRKRCGHRPHVVGALPGEPQVIFPPQTEKARLPAGDAVGAGAPAPPAESGWATGVPPEV